VIVSWFFIASFDGEAAFVLCDGWQVTLLHAMDACNPENWDKSGALYCKVKLIRRF